MLRAPGRASGSVGTSAGHIPARVMTAPSPAPTAVGPDAESRAWVASLGADGARGEEAQARLRELLLRAARFEIGRRRASHPHLRGGDLDDLAQQSANDALLAILGKLETYRGESRFTTWAYKFALLEAAVKLRRRAWQGREIPLDAERWKVFADQGDSPAAECREPRGAGFDRPRARVRAVAPSARGAGGGGAQRRADRRPGRAPRDDPRGALQDDSRRAQEASRSPGRGRAEVRG